MKVKEYRSREVRKRQTDGETIQGKPARAKLKENRSREARKRQDEGETIRGKPANEIQREWGLREARKWNSEGMRLAESPRVGFHEFDARGEPAESFLNVWRSREPRERVNLRFKSEN